MEQKTPTPEPLGDSTNSKTPNGPSFELENDSDLLSSFSTIRKELEDKEESALLPVLVSLIIIVLLIATGFYIWNKNSERNYGVSAAGILNNDPILKQLESVSESDDFSAIEKDLRETDFSQLDVDLAAIEAELSN